LILLWLISLALPAAYINNPNRFWDVATGPIVGLELLFMGWTDFEAGQFGWYANPLFFAVLAIPIRSSRQRYWFYGALLALTATTVSAALWRGSAGVDGQWITPGGPGYYIWLVAMFGAVAWSATRLLLNWRRRRPPAQT
jgi:hypothetical protein